MIVIKFNYLNHFNLRKEITDKEINILGNKKK
jgi:hypothetical protein